MHYDCDEVLALLALSFLHVKPYLAVVFASGVCFAN